MIDKRIEPGEFALTGAATPDDDLNSADALLRKADALLSRHRGGGPDDTSTSWQPADDDDLPLLTDVVAVDALPDTLPGPLSHPYAAPIGGAPGVDGPTPASPFFSEARFDLPEPRHEPAPAAWPPPSEPPFQPWPSAAFASPAFSAPEPFADLPVPPPSGLSWHRDAQEPYIGGISSGNPQAPAEGHADMLAAPFDALDLSGFPPDPFLEPPPSFPPAPLTSSLEADNVLALDDADLSWPLDENLAPLSAHPTPHDAFAGIADKRADTLGTPPQVFRDTPRGERGLALDFVLPPEPTPRPEETGPARALTAKPDTSVLEAPAADAMPAEAAAPEAVVSGAFISTTPTAEPPVASTAMPADAAQPAPIVAAATPATDPNHLIERLVGLDTEIKRLIEDWFAEELPPIVQRELDRLAERIRTEALGQLRATLLPRLSEHIARQLGEPD